MGMKERINQWPKGVQVVVAVLGTLACCLLMWVFIDVCYSQARQMQAIAHTWVRLSGMSQFPKLSNQAISQAASATKMAGFFFAAAWIVPAICVTFLAWSLWLGYIRTRRTS